MLEADVLQVFVGAAGVFGIGLIWINFNEKVFKTVRHLISAPFTWPESACVRKEEELYDEVINRMAPQ